MNSVTDSASGYPKEYCLAFCWTNESDHLSSDLIDPPHQRAKDATTLRMEYYESKGFHCELDDMGDGWRILALPSSETKLNGFVLAEPITYL